jgi:3-dehydroquinate dehydratase / shikimate dehydrogenase
MSLICLSLTGHSIAENLAVLDLYRGQVDIVELRADYLDPSEKFVIRSFPERAGLPCILTVRRRVDGGCYSEGEGVRLVEIAEGLAYARSDRRANFAYVDLESDFHIPAVEEACHIFGTKIIRSLHCTKGLPEDLDAAWGEVTSSAEEIPKLALACTGAGDLARLITWASALPERERIIVGMGEYGFPSRILAERLGSLVCYTSPLAAGLPGAAPGQVDPEVLAKSYRFHSIGPRTEIYALAGGKSVISSRSPALHNTAFGEALRDAVYVPIPAESVEAFFAAADALGVRGASVTVPLKEALLPFVRELSPEAKDIGACNTLLREGEGWLGYNTDAIGFEKALLEFLERRDLSGFRATILGAGGAARAVAYVLSRLGAACLIVNRSANAARSLAKGYGFAWGSSDERSADLVADHADLIVNATSVGMHGGTQGDPLEWYDFTGREAVFDLIYRPERTALLARARASGAKISNGYSMLRYQAAEQFRIWTGREPPASYLSK